MTLYPDANTTGHPRRTRMTTDTITPASHRAAWLAVDDTLSCYVCQRPTTTGDCTDGHRGLVAAICSRQTWMTEAEIADARARVANQLAYNNAKLAAVDALDAGNDDDDAWLARILAANDRLDYLAAATNHTRHVDYLDLEHELTTAANALLEDQR